MIVYDDHFNANEWSVLIGLLIGTLIVLFFPKRFSNKVTIVFIMCGIFSGFFFDHTVSVQPVSFYDVNDKSTYQFIDFISYLTFGPICYLYLYIFDRVPFFWRKKPIYILMWSFIYIGMEFCAVLAGVYHYNHGYKIYYSFPIYLIVSSAWLVVYYRYHNQ